MRAFVKRHELLHKVVHATWCRVVGPFDKRRVATTGQGIGSPLSLTVSVSPNPANVGQTVTFTGSPSGGTPPYVFTWQYGDGGGAGNVNPTTYAYETSGAFTGSAVVLDGAYNEVETLFTENVNSRGAFTIIASANPDQGYYPPNFTTQFTATPYNADGPIYWEYDFGDGEQAFVQNPQHTYTSPFFYIVTVTGYIAETGERTQFVFPVIVLPAI